MKAAEVDITKPPAERPLQFRIVHLLIAMAVCGILLAVFVPLWRVARRAAMQIDSKNKLHQLGVAFHNYHDVWLQFPPAYQTDQLDQPVHSWRVLTHPFQEASSFYSLYKFT